MAVDEACLDVTGHYSLFPLGISGSLSQSGCSGTGTLPSLSHSFTYTVDGNQFSNSDEFSGIITQIGTTTTFTLDNGDTWSSVEAICC